MSTPRPRVCGFVDTPSFFLLCQVKFKSLYIISGVGLVRDNGFGANLFHTKQFLRKILKKPILRHENLPKTYWPCMSIHGRPSLLWYILLFMARRKFSISSNFQVEYLQRAECASPRPINECKKTTPESVSQLYATTESYEYMPCASIQRLKWNGSERCPNSSTEDCNTFHRTTNEALGTRPSSLRVAPKST